MTEPKGCRPECADCRSRILTDGGYECAEDKCHHQIEHYTAQEYERAARILSRLVADITYRCRGCPLDRHCTDDAPCDEIVYQWAMKEAAK